MVAEDSIYRLVGGCSVQKNTQGAKDTMFTHFLLPMDGCCENQTMPKVAAFQFSKAASAHAKFECDTMLLSLAWTSRQSTSALCVHLAGEMFGSSNFAGISLRCMAQCAQCAQCAHTAQPPGAFADWDGTWNGKCECGWRCRWNAWTLQVLRNTKCRFDALIARAC